MDRRKFLKFGSMAAGTFGVVACENKTVQVDARTTRPSDSLLPDPFDSSSANAGTANTNIYTIDEPGPWVGKEAGHLPIVSVVNGMLQITTNHEMTLEHFIGRHQVIDAKNQIILADYNFEPIDTTLEKAVSLLAVPLPSGNAFHVRSLCNKHGWWQTTLNVADFAEGFSEGAPEQYFTRENPGKWAGKENGHLPTISAADGAILVTTTHGMKKEHFITRHRMADANGVVLADHKFTHDENATSAESRLVGHTPYTDVFHIFSACNLHGWWRETFNTADYLDGFTDIDAYTQNNPGPWKGKEAGHLPQISLLATGEIQVVTSHVMENDHYISRHTIKDDFGNILADRILEPGVDTTATSTFDVILPPEGNIHVFSLCNEHDNWKITVAVADLITVYTAANPGVFNPVPHTPEIEATLDINNIQTGVLVRSGPAATPHEMTNAHWITKHEIRNSSGILLAQQNFSQPPATPPAEPPVAENVFPIGALYGDSFNVYSHCNLHGLWRQPFSYDQVFSVYDNLNPGPWAGREAGHIPQVDTTGDVITISTQHEMIATHLITKHQIRETNGKLLAENTFKAGDTAVSRFPKSNTLKGNLIAYSSCNLHGIWKQTFSVS